MKPKTWTRPAGTTYNLFTDALSQPHLLIGGATGSGKSVLINGLIATALYRAPDTDARYSYPSRVTFILIDPKKVALAKFRNLPHTIKYADTHESIIEAIAYAEGIMDARFQETQRRGIEDYDGGDLYIIIDELMDLMTTPATKKRFKPILQRIAQLGRAAKVHVIAATQCPISVVIPTEIKCNFDTRFGLRTECQQDSRNIIRRNGCELLPDPKITHDGQAYYKKSADIVLYSIPMIDQEEMTRLISHWMNQTKPARRGLFRRKRRVAILTQK